MLSILRAMRGVRQWCCRADHGAGTVSAVAGIAVAAVMMATIAAGGNVLLCRERARASADLAALAGAQAAWNGSADPCLAAQEAARLNTATMQQCVVNHGDVTVQVRVRTAVPWIIASVSMRSRAGPVPCDDVDTLSHRGHV